MQTRVALLHGCYLFSDNGKDVLIHCRDCVYSAGDTLPAMMLGSSLARVTAREFVRHSMLALSGDDEKGWPKLARTFIGEAG
jgi:hypothetical protein